VISLPAYLSAPGLVGVLAVLPGERPQRPLVDRQIFHNGALSDMHNLYGLGVARRQAGDLSYFFVGVARKPDGERYSPVLST